MCKFMLSDYKFMVMFSESVATFPVAFPLKRPYGKPAFFLMESEGAG